MVKGTRTSVAANLPWRSLAAAIFLPNLLFSIGQGAITPVIPVIAHNLGSSLANAGFVASMLVVGVLVADLPSGALVTRFGERSGMLAALALTAIAASAALLARSLWMLGLAVFAMGLATAVFYLARHAFLTTSVPFAARARAMSTLGGTFRLGFLIGPFLSAWLITATGSPKTALWVQLAACIAAGIVVLIAQDPREVAEAHRQTNPTASPRSTRAGNPPDPIGGGQSRRHALVTVGVGAATLAALRASRQVLLPMWGLSLGMSEASIAMVVGMGGAIDVALFYTGGWAMDRFGRLRVIVPSMVGLGIGHVVLSFTHDPPNAVSWFIGVVVALSLANGLTAGVLMTLGSDLADPTDPAPFLATWRFTTDAGQASAPLLISGVTALASLTLAAFCLGVLGFAGALILRLSLPRYRATGPD
ncbi:MAG: MFS transporter [Bifidobacteriaceae bacterium]|jgi:MFS family permease|nr:MFS transporter [Bifidobacteriaceae bacterium]